MKFFTRLILIFIISLSVLGAAEVRLRTAVEKQQVAVGEPFVWQLTIEGTLSPELPSIEEIRKLLPDFTVAFLGVRPQNSSSTVIINGHKTVNESKSATVQYQLAAKRIGALTIPGVTFTAEGKKLTSAPVAIRARKAGANPNFILEAQLPRETLYVGETVLLPVTLYFRERINSLQFTAPLLDIPGFQTILPQERTGADDEAVIALNGENIVVRQGKKELNGHDFAAVFFTLMLKATAPGEHEIPAFSASGVYGGDGFFTRGKSFFTAGKTQKITVKELPVFGRPAEFSGLIGKFSLAAQIEPAEAAVGDPLTLTVLVSGSGYMGDVELPDLNRDPAFAASFKIPEERADGKNVAGARVFTQTLRAVSEKTAAVPPVTLHFFNPESGKYESASSAPLKLKIKPAKVIGTEALEGFTGSTGKNLESERLGLAPNYIDAGCLRPEIHRSAFFTGWQRILFIALPLLYLALWCLERWRGRRYRTADRRRAREALGEFRTRLAVLQQSPNGMAELPEALRAYFAARFGLPAAGLTFADIAPHLPPSAAGDSVPPAQEGISLAKRLEEIFAKAEAARYAAGGGAGISPEFAREVLSAVTAAD